MRFARLMRMTVRAVFALVLVFMLVKIARVGMLVCVDVLVFVSVRNPIVGVLMQMSMSVFVLVLVAMIVRTFHRIPLRSSSGLEPA